MELIQHKNKWYIKSDTGYKEVLATTDKSLFIQEENQCDGCKANLPLEGFVHKDSQSMGIACSKNKYITFLPQPSQEFIEKYCKEGGIDEAMIECDIFDDPDFKLDLGKEMRLTPKILERLKVDPTHNTITIHPAASKEEQALVFLKRLAIEWGENWDMVVDLFGEEDSQEWDKIVGYKQ